MNVENLNSLGLNSTSSFFRLAAAKKDNDFIYHEKVPDIRSMPDVKGRTVFLFDHGIARITKILLKA